MTDWADSFYQQLDSDRLLAKHGPVLFYEASALIKIIPIATAGVILMPGAFDDIAIRAAIERMTGMTIPENKIIATICQRRLIEDILEEDFKEMWSQWKEKPGEKPTGFPILVCCPSGFRLGVYRFKE
jgi:hypothetical protein